MTRGVRLYLVGSVVLVALSGCGRGFFQSAEREPWRAEAEIACLKSGTVKESVDVVRIEPISGPGVCGADYPLKVAAFGETGSAYGFADESPRPPANIGGQPRWPTSQGGYSQSPYPQQQPYPSSQGYPSSQNYPPPQNYPETAVRQQGYGAASNGPISLAPPGVAPDQDEIELPPQGVPGRDTVVRSPYQAPQNYPQQNDPPSSYPQRDRYSAPSAQPALPALGPARGDGVAAVGPVAVKPAATLACPIVSALDRWLTDSVQPASQRWFNSRVVEIKQISAYSCRGMNGNPNAHISEHAFGNALDIAAFTLADGRRITVKDGWRGLPEEQGFLRDVQAAACQRFSTVLAPGSNVYHYDHIHVDLMRRASGNIICEPDAVSGEEIASRAAHRNPYASRGPFVTGSLGGQRQAPRKRAREKVDEEDEFEDE